MNDKKTIGLPLLPLTLCYLALPLVIFFCNWVRPFYAFLAIAPILFAGGCLIRQWPKEPYLFEPVDIGLTLVISFGLTAFMGIGAFGFQDYDWIKHNAVLFDCVHLPWPVQVVHGADTWPLVYYLAYYLPAAMAGKITGYAGAQIALWIWTSIGVALACFWFARLAGLRAGIACVAFFAFSGLDFFANLLVQFTGLVGNPHAVNYFPGQSWSKIWQFPSNYWALQWSPGQTLAAWLSAGIFLSCPRSLRLGCLAVLFTCVIFWSPFVGIGLCLLAFLLACRERPVFSAGQLLPAGSLVLPLGILAAFYASKTAPDVVAQFGKIPVGWFFQFHYAPSPLRAFILLPLFVVLELGILLWLVRRHTAGHERNLADSVALALLFLLPVTVGYENDLCLRASGVPLFCLAVLLARTIMSENLSLRTRRWLWLLILAGCLAPLTQAARQGHNLLIGRHDPLTVPHEVSAVINMPVAEHLKVQYLGSDNSFFWRHLAVQNHP